MIIIHFSQFSAPYKGSFIRSLERLEEMAGDKNEFFYCFPRKAETVVWMSDFIQKHQVFFTTDTVENSCGEIMEIYRKVNPDIVHSHFDGYDIPISRARDLFLQETGKYIKVIWHLHNQIRYEKNYIKKIYQYIVFKNHYGKWAKKANIISINEGMKNFINYFSKRSNLNVKTVIIPNGIDTHYFTKQQSPHQNKEYVFGLFGSFNNQKRIDIILLAGKILINKGLEFKIVIVKGVDTDEVIETIFGNNIPNWVKLLDRTDKIEEFYNQISCFVSTSIHETFSYAIAEATIFGLPIIQSDIPGTSWNSENPSAFLFETLNIDALATVMEKLIYYPKEEMRKKCSVTKQNNIERFGVDLWCDRVSKFYENAQ